MQIPSWPTPQVEDDAGGAFLNRFQERFIVLAYIVISRAMPEIGCKPVIMLDGYFGNASQSHIIEGGGQLVGITLWLNRCPRFPIQKAPLYARTSE